MANPMLICLTVEAGEPGAASLELSLVSDGISVHGQAFMTQDMQGGGNQTFAVSGSQSTIVFNGNEEIILNLKGATLYTTGGTMALQARLSADYAKGIANWEATIEGHPRQEYENKPVERTKCTQA